MSKYQLAFNKGICDICDHPVEYNDDCVFVHKHNEDEILIIHSNCSKEFIEENITLEK